MVRRTAFCFLLIALAAVNGCGPRESAQPPAAVRTDDGPRDGGRLLRRFESDVATLNFARHTTAFEKSVLSYLHDPLLDLDQQLNLIPALATSWSVSPDGRLYTLRLDPRATFSDGQPVTAEDVVFTLGKLVDPASPSPQYAPMFSSLDLDRTRAVDLRTVEVAFGEARPDQLFAFNIPVLPKHFYGTGEFARDFNQKVLGSGPYVLTRHEAGRNILLSRRDNYWRELPHIAEIEFRIIPDDAMAWNAMRSGEIDEMRMNSDQWKAQKDDPETRRLIDIRRYYPLSYNFVPWNTKDPILSDPRVRRALAMCFDRRAVINNLFHGTARVVTGPYVPTQSAYNPAVKPIEFDPDAARRLLQEAGWTDSDGDGILDRNQRRLDLELLLPAGSATSAAQAQVFEQGLRKAGVNARLSVVDAPVMFERVLSGQFQGAFLAWDLDLDPDLYALFHSSQMPPAGTNFVHYANPEVDRLIEEGRTTLDAAKRKEIYQRLHAVLAEDQPYMWLLQVSTKWGVNRRVRNVEEAEGLGLFLWYPGAKQWWLAGPPVAGDAVAIPQ